MRVVVVVPGRANLDSAGVRIRYNRLIPTLFRLGVELSVRLIDSLTAKVEAEADVYLISKCYDVRSLILADRMHEQGKHVGIDIFDDYFSQMDDSRLVHMRQWFREISKVIDFATTASSQMAIRLQDLGLNKPVHVIDDPYDDWDVTAAAAQAEKQMHNALAKRSIEICWFGMGDNEYFAAGLADLHGHSGALARLARTGFAVKLRILTNSRALTSDRLEMIARVPVSTEVAEWSLEAEKQLLASSLVAFLPVNRQPFSTVKSNNRAVTALTNGVQVLSQGFPLYGTLSSVIYSDPNHILDDINRQQMRFGGHSAQFVDKSFRELADPVDQATRFYHFIRDLSPGVVSGSKNGKAAIIHGARSFSNVEKFVHAAGGLSLGSPFSVDDFGTDVFLAKDGSTGEFFVSLSDKAVEELDPTMRSKVAPHTLASGKRTYSIPAPVGMRALSNGLPSEADLALYRTTMRQYTLLIKQMFPNSRIYLSEHKSPQYFEIEQSYIPGNSSMVSELAS